MSEKQVKTADNFFKPSTSRPDRGVESNFVNVCVCMCMCVYVYVCVCVSVYVWTDDSSRVLGSRIEVVFDGHSGTVLEDETCDVDPHVVLYRLPVKVKKTHDLVPDYIHD